MAITLEEIAKVTAEVDSLSEQIKSIEEARNAGIVRIAVLENERALFNVTEERDVEAFRAEMLVLADETKTTMLRERKLTDWVRTIDPAFSFRGWGIDNDRNELFPDFAVEVPKEITEEFVRNVNFFARIVTPVQPARLRIINEAFMSGYTTTFLKFDGDNLENAAIVSSSFNPNKAPVIPLISALRKLSEQSFASWLNSSN